MRLERRWHVGLLVLVMLGVLGMTAHRAIDRVINPDEIEAVHSSWLVWQGQRPYFDFYQLHHPLLYYALAPIVGLAPERAELLLSLRCLFYGGMIATVIVHHAIARQLANRWTAWIATFLLATTLAYTNKGYEIRPDLPQTFFSLLAVLFLLRHAKTRSWFDLHGTALSLAVAFLFLQKTLFLLVAVLAIAGLRVARKTLTLRELGLALASFSLVVGAFYLHIAWTGDLKRYYLVNWLVNAHPAGAFSSWFSIIELFQEGTLVWVFAGLYALRWARRGPRLDWLVLTGCMLVSVVLVKRPWPHYFMLPLALLSIGAAGALTTIFRRERFALVLVVCMSTAPAWYTLWAHDYPHNRGQLARIQWVLDATKPGERVYDGACLWNLARPDLDYFWFSTGPGIGGLARFQAHEPYAYDLYGLLRRHQPRIISLPHMADRKDERILRMYRPSDRFPDLFVLRESHGGVTP